MHTATSIFYTLAGLMAIYAIYRFFSKLTGYDQERQYRAELERELAYRNRCMAELLDGGEPQTFDDFEQEAQTRASGDVQLATAE